VNRIEIALDAVLAFACFGDQPEQHLFRRFPFNREIERILGFAPCWTGESAGESFARRN